MQTNDERWDTKCGTICEWKEVDEGEDVLEEEVTIGIRERKGDGAMGQGFDGLREDGFGGSAKPLILSFDCLSLECKVNMRRRWHQICRSSSAHN